MKDISKVMLLLGAGFAAGTITGILFAPDKGDKTRDRIRSKANELSEDIEKTYDEEIARLKSKIDKVKANFSKEVANIVGDDVDKKKVNVHEN